MDQINILKPSPYHKDLTRSQYPTTVVTANRRDPPLEGGHSTRIGVMWNIKNEIISPKLYEILIKTNLKRDTALDLKKFYNHINMCLNAVTRIREDLLHAYQSIKRYSAFKE